MFIILTGKTASGKDTIKFALLNKFPLLKKVLTTTSRSQRANEAEGVDYHFLSKNEFKRKVNLGDFAEYVEYGGNLYGTEKKRLEQALNGDTLWKIDPSRAGEARDFLTRTFSPNLAETLIKKLVVVYITTSDQEILQRLKKRGLNKEEIQKRMADDRKIWQQYKDNYDFVVENTPGNLDKTVSRVVQIIESRKEDVETTPKK